MNEGMVFELEGIEYTILYTLNENEKKYILVSSGDDDKTKFDVFECYDEDNTIVEIGDSDLKSDLMGKFLIEGINEVK